MKNFKKYLVESQREYHYRIKTVVDLDSDRLEKIERLLRKYDLIEMSKPEVVDVNKLPLDFKDLEGKAIWIVDAIIGMPVSSYILGQEIKASLNVAERFVIVRSDNERVEVETNKIEALKDIDKEIKAKGLKSSSRLSTESHYDADEIENLPGQAYGDEYNKKLLKYLRHVEDTRKSQNKEPHSPLFSWLEMDKVKAQEPQQDLHDFNEYFDGPKPEAKGDKQPPISDEYIATDGNFDLDVKTYSKKVVDPETGKIEYIKAKAKPIRKSKVR